MKRWMGILALASTVACSRAHPVPSPAASSSTTAVASSSTPEAASVAPAASSDVRAPRRDSPPAAESMPANALDDFDLRVRRTPCYGPCPVYFVHVDAKGRIEAGVTPKGPLSRAGTLAPSELGTLVRAFYALGFFELPDQYPAQATDAASIVIQLRSAGRSKTVSHDESNRNAPAELLALEALIAKLTRAEQYGSRGPSPSPRPRPL